MTDQTLCDGSHGTCHNFLDSDMVYMVRVPGLWSLVVLMFIIWALDKLVIFWRGFPHFVGAHSADGFQTSMSISVFREPVTGMAGSYHTAVQGVVERKTRFTALMGGKGVSRPHFDQRTRV
jgi:hypothetical protein